MSGVPPLGCKHVVVIGASSGIGAALTQVLAQHGSRVIAVARRAQPLHDMAAQYTNITPMVANVCTPGSEHAIFANAKNSMGSIDGVVYCAGVVHHALPGSNTDAHVTEQIQVNLRAPLACGEAALDVLDDGGAFLALSSTLATRPIATSTYYSAAKAGLEAGMRSLAISAATRGLRFNSLALGLVDTPMLRGTRPGELDERALLEKLSALQPLGRLGSAEEVAHFMMHMLQTPWLTGSTLTLDGGLLLRE